MTGILRLSRSAGSEVSWKPVVHIWSWIFIDASVNFDSTIASPEDALASFLRSQVRACGEEDAYVHAGRNEERPAERLSSKE